MAPVTTPSWEKNGLMEVDDDDDAMIVMMMFGPLVTIQWWVFKRKMHVGCFNVLEMGFFYLRSLDVTSNHCEITFCSTEEQKII